MVYYDENMTLLCHAKKLAATNDLVALKELCRKQVINALKFIFVLIKIVYKY